MENSYCDNMTLVCEKPLATYGGCGESEKGSVSFNQMVLDTLPIGGVSNPIYLELAGGADIYARPTLLEASREEKLIVGNVDKCAEPWGDKTVSRDLNTCELGLHEPDFEPILEEGALVGVMISHIQMAIRSDIYRLLISSAVDRLVPGGVLIICDKTNVYYQRRMMGDSTGFRRMWDRVNQARRTTREFIAEGSSELMDHFCMGPILPWYFENGRMRNFAIKNGLSGALKYEDEGMYDKTVWGIFGTVPLVASQKVTILRKK